MVVIGVAVSGMNGHIQKRVKLFLDQYREGMTPAERKASIKREKAFNRRFMLWFLPRALKIMVPFYDPGKAKAHPRLQQALKKYDALAAETEALKAGAVPA